MIFLHFHLGALCICLKLSPFDLFFSHPLAALMFNTRAFVACARRAKGDCYCVLSVKERVCQEINCNKSQAQLIYRTIVELICLMNHIIHPIILRDPLNNRPLKINQGWREEKDKRISARQDAPVNRTRTGRRKGPAVLSHRLKVVTQEEKKTDYVTPEDFGTNNTYIFY